ncbi:MAG TPA: hypothetical protein VFU15_14985 [Bacteroidia bacterium]|nr:hypothetical protein [Bacteroidia bacterium]
MKRIPCFLFFLLVFASCDEKSSPPGKSVDSVMRRFSFIRMNTSEPPRQKTVPDSTFLRIMRQDAFFHRHDTIVKQEFRAFACGSDSFWVIRTQKGDSVYTRVYKKNKRYRLVISDEEGWDWSPWDTVLDADFDGYADYLLGIYSPCGCCPRENYHVYFYDPGMHSLRDNDVYVMNPYFDSASKSVYCMDYGFPYPPQPAGLTKYRWSGDSLVETEGVDYDWPDTVLSLTNLAKTRRGSSPHDSLLRDLPAPYKKIPQVEFWFYTPADSLRMVRYFSSNAKR